MRLDHPETKPARVVPRKDFDDDRRHGYVILEWTPERVEIIQDRRTGREIQRTLSADIMYRCVDCQFDTVDHKTIKEHRTEGKHPWTYSPFKNPYGHVSDVVIEGIENYQDFLDRESQRSK